MRNQTAGRVFLVLCGALAIGCRSSSIGNLGPAGQQAAAAATPSPVPSTPAIGQNLLSMTMTMEVDVLGIKFCTGTAHVKLNVNLNPSDANFQFLQLPNSMLDCGIQQIDLSKLLGGLDNTTPPNVPNPMYVASNVIHLKVLGDDIYTPGRPLIPAIFTADPTALQSLNYGLDVQLRPNATTLGGSGHVTVTSTGYQESLAYAPLNMTVGKVYDFNVANSGFSGVDKLDHFLFTSMAFRVSLAPITLLQLDLTTQVSDILDVVKSTNTSTAVATSTATSTGLGGALSTIGSLIGKLIDVKIHATLTQMDGLSQTSGNVNAGEVIGGKPTGN